MESAPGKFSSFAKLKLTSGGGKEKEKEKEVRTFFANIYDYSGKSLQAAEVLLLYAV